ncbi:MAG: 2-oxo acid dehydrogenase subunit E2 [Spirochaetales bacterium]|nr:MAG: 2-oxo acid dehydrogenase subunit E2 [Spirochaetales bacterium]
MRFIFKFPDIGEGITEGRIVQWYAARGQAVEAGQPLLQMETDKVVTDIPSPRSGIVAERYGREGDTVRVGGALVELDIQGVEGEDAQGLLLEEREREKQPARQKAAEEGAAGVVGVLEIASDRAYLPGSLEGVETPVSVPVPHRALATPVARAMAKKAGIDIRNIKGTGPAGRVTKEDVKNAGSGAAFERRPGGQEIELIKTSMLRSTIARRMIESLRQTAQITVFEEAEVTALKSLRDRSRPRFQEKGIHLTWLPFVVRACVKALRDHPLLNSEMDKAGETIIVKKYYHIGIAVDTEEGLLVPVLRDADKKNISLLAEELAQMSEKARSRKLSLEDMKDGTFTITNYGIYGGRFATPVLNYPQTAILGLGRIRKQAVAAEQGLREGTVLPLSLTVDHRVIDGGEASRFLSSLIAYLEEPAMLLMA